MLRAFSSVCVCVCVCVFAIVTILDLYQQDPRKVSSTCLSPVHVRVRVCDSLADSQSSVMSFTTQAVCPLFILKMSPHGHADSIHQTSLNIEIVEMQNVSGWDAW